MLALTTPFGGAMGSMLRPSRSKASNRIGAAASRPIRPGVGPLSGRPTQTAIVVLFVAAAVIVGPSFALLFSLQGRRLLHADDADAVLATAPPHQTQPPAASPAARAAVLALVVVDALVRARARRRGR